MSFSIHPNYNTGNQKNDIALIRVKEKIEFNMKVGPACLPFKNSNNSFAGEVVYAVGEYLVKFISQQKCAVMTRQ